MGFGFCYMLNFKKFPFYKFCSITCLDEGAAIARETLGMIDKSQREITALKDTRRELAKVLKEMGLLLAFRDRSATDMDRIIECCVDAFQESVHRQVDESKKSNKAILDDDIPF